MSARTPGSGRPSSGRHLSVPARQQRTAFDPSAIAPEPAALAAELRLARTEVVRLRALLEHHPDALFALDGTGAIVETNAACATLFGRPRPELASCTLAQLVAADDAARTADHVRLAIEGGSAQQKWTAAVVGRDGGNPRSIEIVLIPSRDGAPRFYGIGRDVTRHRALEEQLALQALHDPLTGLANRLLFRDRLERALSRSATPASSAASPATAPAAATGGTAATPPTAAPGQCVAVLFIDLDDFKAVNDALGHAEGDRLLEEVTARLLKATRGFDLVGRLGGDEFGVLLDGMMREDDADAVVARIAAALKRPVALRGREVVVGASIGVAHARDARTADDLLRNADIAMHQAKASGKGRHAQFDRAMHVAAITRIELAADVRQAVANDELRLVYQPVVALATGAVVGAEALLRWHHPERGVVPPLDFIPLAEETGAILPIGRWVLREACAELARWRATVPGGDALTMSVNVSGRQLDDDGAFVADVRDALAATGIPADRLTLEITESVIMQRADDALATLRALKALGVSLAIDDFGTGYSSLGYLQRFPVDVLKIDRAFVDGVARGGSDAALARTIVALGDSLGLRAVAEGIENGAQQAALAALGCPLGQGYLFARPLAPDAFTRHVIEGRGPAGA